MSTFKKLNETNCSILSQESMMQIHGGAFPCECILSGIVISTTLASSAAACIEYCDKAFKNEQNSPDYGNNH